MEFIDEFIDATIYQEPERTNEWCYICDEYILEVEKNNHKECWEHRNIIEECKTNWKPCLNISICKQWCRKNTYKLCDECKQKEKDSEKIIKEINNELYKLSVSLQGTKRLKP